MSGCEGESLDISGTGFQLMLDWTAEGLLAWRFLGNEYGSLKDHERSEEDASQIIV